MSAEAVELLFRTFSRRFTHRWTKNFEDKAARKLWRLDLARAGVTDQTLRIGLAKCADAEWPPSTGEFIRLCRPAPEDYGLPAVEAAYREACRGAYPHSEHAWSHPAVYHAAREAGQWELTNLPESKSRALFERAYAVTCRAVMAGEALPEVPKALPATVSVRAKPETVRASLEAARAALHGGDHASNV